MTIDQVQGTQTATNAQAVRIEKDLVGECEVPAEAYYGVHTLRSVQNFPITGQTIGGYPELVRGLAAVKAAAAKADQESGKLTEDQADAIIQACDDIGTGRVRDQFVVTVIQGSA